MATYRERAEEIAARIRAVEGSGVVHARNRVTEAWGDYADRFVHEDRVNGWQVTRQAPSKLDGHRWEEAYSLVKIYGVHDESESDFAFQENVDAVIRAFRDDGVLSFGTTADGVRIDEMEDRRFGDALCHVAECSMVVSFYYSEL